MSEPEPISRRTLLGRIALGLSIGPAFAADPPLLSEQEPAARAVHYVEDAARASAAPSGANCANCSIYSAAGGASVGKCTLFPNKLVKGAGWCNAWSGL